jgi:hypothetical protein
MLNGVNPAFQLLALRVENCLVLSSVGERGWRLFGGSNHKEHMHFMKDNPFGDRLGKGFIVQCVGFQ